MFIQGISGNFSDVDENGHLLTESITRPKDNFINGDSGKVWSLSFAGVDPTGAADKFFYLKNTGAESIRVTDIRLSSTVTGIASVKKVSGTPTYTSETVIAGVSRRTGKSPVLQATAVTDADITGLADDGTWFFIPLDSAGKQTHLRTSSNLIIDSGGALAIEWDTATGILTGTVSVVENGID